MHSSCRVILWRGGGAQSLPLTHSCPNAPRSPNAALTNAEIFGEVLHCRPRYNGTSPQLSKPTDMSVIAHWWGTLMLKQSGYSVTVNVIMIVWHRPVVIALLN